MHGQGTYVYASGDIYTGSFVEGIKQGSGSYYFKVSATLRYLALDAWRHNVKQHDICHAFPDSIHSMLAAVNRVSIYWRMGQGHFCKWNLGIE